MSNKPKVIILGKLVFINKLDTIDSIRETNSCMRNQFVCKILPIGTFPQGEICTNNLTICKQVSSNSYMHNPALPHYWHEQP